MGGDVKRQSSPIANSKIGSHGDVPSQIIAGDVTEEEQQSKVTEVIGDTPSEPVQPLPDEEEEERHDSDAAVGGVESLEGSGSEEKGECITSESKLQSTESPPTVHDWNAIKMKVDGMNNGEANFSDVAQIPQPKKDADKAEGDSTSTVATADRNGFNLDHVTDAEAIVFQEKGFLVVRKKP